MKEQFSRTEMLLGPESTHRLAAARVMVFGLGGVGSYTVEALARAGIGQLTLVDEDTVSVTNLNRQLGALHSTLGMSKAEALAARVRDINPDCRVLPLTERYDAEHKERFFSLPCDWLRYSSVWMMKGAMSRNSPTTCQIRNSSLTVHKRS